MKSGWIGLRGTPTAPGAETFSAKSQGAQGEERDGCRLRNRTGRDFSAGIVVGITEDGHDGLGARDIDQTNIDPTIAQCIVQRAVLEAERSEEHTSELQSR